MASLGVPRYFPKVLMFNALKVASNCDLGEPRQVSRLLQEDSSWCAWPMDIVL